MTDSAGKSWYSGYKSAIVGSPRSPWAGGQSPEDEVCADDVNGDVFLPDETKLPEKTGKVSDGDPGKATIDQNNNEADALKRADHDGPPSSMEFLDLETDHTRRTPRRAFWASFSDEVDYEQYQPTKRYEKPPEKIQRSMSARVYIVGGSTDNHCKACGRRLYEMEKVIADRCSYHKHCFKCTQCQRILSLANYISVDGQPHCKSHFKELVVAKPTKAAPTGQTTATAARTDKATPSQPTTSNGLRDSAHHVMTSSKPVGDETTARRHGADGQPEAASLRTDVQEVPKATRFETDVTDASRPNDDENSKRSGVGIASLDRNDVRPERRSDAQGDATKVNKRVRFSDDLTSVYCLPFTQLESSVDPPNFPEKVSFLEVQLNVAPNRATNFTGPLPSADTEQRHPGSRDDEVQLPSVAGVLAKFESLEVGPARDVPGPTRKIIRRMTPFHLPPQVSGSGDSDEDEPKSDDKKGSEKELGVRDGSDHPAFRGNQDSRTGVDGIANGSDEPDGHRGPEANARMSGHVDLLTSSVVDEGRDSDDDDDDWRNAKTVDLPEPGLTRTLLTHWKTLEQGSKHEDRQRSSWTAGAEPGAADARYASLHAEPPHRPVLMTRSLSTPTGFGSGIETVRRSSLGFTRNRLAKFRHLEAMNLEKTSGPIHHKNFKWGVKEPNFLHKPVTLSSASPHQANPHPAPPSVPPPSNHADHHEREPATSGDDEPLRRTTDDGPPHLENEDPCSVENMRRALERFRSMEDPTLPPPTPTTTGAKRVSVSGVADGKAMSSSTLNGH